MDNPSGGNQHHLQDLTWTPGQDPGRPPHLEAQAGHWFDEEPGLVTIRRYPASYFVAYIGYAGADDWTQDGDGDGLIMHSVAVILAKIPRADFEANVDAYIQSLYPRVEKAWREWGWPE